jgi:hypothetical protein
VHLPPAPPWMADLPRPHHPRAKIFESQPAFAACQWVSGKPILSLDLRKLRILAIRGRCWLCGYPVVRAGYVVVTQADHTDRYGDLHTEGCGPVHHSCALFAVAVCPFLKYSQSRRRITGTGLRGIASIKGFDQYAVVFPPDPAIFMCFGYFSPTETVSITNQAQVAELYEEALKDDAATNFTATPRLYWSDEDDDLRRLRAEWLQIWEKLQAWAETSVVTIDRNTYRGHALGGFIR